MLFVSGRLPIILEERSLSWKLREVIRLLAFSECCFPPPLDWFHWTLSLSSFTFQPTKNHELLINQFKPCFSLQSGYIILDFVAFFQIFCCAFQPSCVTNVSKVHERPLEGAKTVAKWDYFTPFKIPYPMSTIIIPCQQPPFVSLAIKYQGSPYYQPKQCTCILFEKISQKIPSNL